jgi:hypothetical protein
MFIFRWIRNIFTLIGVITVAYWGWNYYMNPTSSVRQKVDTFKESPVVKEGVKDLQTWGGEIVKEIKGRKELDELTPDEQKELDELIGKEAKKNK